MARVRLQHRFEYFFYRRFRAAILRRPHAEVRAFGARFGRWGHSLIARSRKIALANLERVFPEMPEDERRRIVLACFEHFAATFCEAISIGRFSAEEVLDLFDFEGWEQIDALVESMAAATPGGKPRRGFFIHTGHFGHWETALFPLALRLEPFHAVARPLNNPLISAELTAMRERLGARIIAKKGAALQMRRALRAGANVGIMIDQHLRTTSRIQVPFLGHPAWTSPMLAVLSLQLGVPVVPIACYPVEGGRYRLVVGKPVQGEGKGKEAAADLTVRIQEDLEERIRDRPELWLWMHRRWRDR